MIYLAFLKANNESGFTLVYKGPRRAEAFRRIYSLSLAASRRYKVEFHIAESVVELSCNGNALPAAVETPEFRALMKDASVRVADKTGEGVP